MSKNINASSKGFADTFAYNIIYVFTIPDQTHRGYLKIGQTSLTTDTSIDRLTPNSHELNQSAKNRIKQYTNTAGITFKLLHTELAIKDIKSRDGNLILKSFTDNDVHRVLKNSHIKNTRIGNTTGDEWFKIDLETAKKAIAAVKKNYENLSNSTVANEFAPIIFRPEQEDCIGQAVKWFRNNDRFLINAKMRYGKTLVSLEIIKRCKFNKTIIMTHRPVVDAGWYEDFHKIFHGDEDIIYGSKATGYKLEDLLKESKRGKKFIYFASIQDLRGSAEVGGKHEKNDDVFDTVWDCVIVDEAHEGTTTELGDKTVKAVVKEGHGTKLLSLSGTPFNILDDYDINAIYTWDYIMEQENKNEWDKFHFGDHNPYEDLPELRIYTYDLGDILQNNQYITFEDKAFNFKEFFRTFTGEFKRDHVNMPSGAKTGDFVHEDDVKSFLNLMTKEDKESRYPYSNEEYRNLFKHTLWMVPGVREARALKKLMLDNKVFGSGQFEIVNVAGDGDEEENSEEALSKVKSAIKSAEDLNRYTITLSCGKLTTGVTVKEWTGVFMLSGSYSTSAANYLQTIFRVQSPCNKNGRMKKVAYVFDFAPDRTLKMVASAVRVSSKSGKTQVSDKKIMGKFLNYCPVISVSGSKMKAYSTSRLLQQLKRAYADKVVRHGFDDVELYNDELLKLDELDIKKFDELKKIIGKSQAAPKTNDIIVNDQGLTDEEYEKLEKLKKKPKKELTADQKKFLEEVKKKKKLKKDAISILRSISIRMPLLIYGADIPYDEEINLDKFIEIIDDNSWNEFMPTGVTKQKFKEFKKYYDEDVFIAAGRRIRNIAREADTLEPTERVKKIAGLFTYFKNPDKETVLTPWRVVNMHMSDCLGGWCFYDKTFKEEQKLEQPRFVDNGDVTNNIFNNLEVHILEINSKTGLYPLYMTYSVYRRRIKNYTNKDLTLEDRQLIWNEAVTSNIFVICKTPMAKDITKRTLVGYSKEKINAHYFDDLINMMKNKSQTFIDKVLKKSYWKKGSGLMNFDAIVGNPPYQQMDGGHGASSKPVYNYFVEQSKSLNPNYISMIMPARWYIGGKGLDKFRQNMLSDHRVEKLIDFPRDKDVFPTVDIAGGICYFLWDNKYSGECFVSNVSNGERNTVKRRLDEYPTLVRDNKAINIVRKVVNAHKGPFMNSVVYPRKPFGLDTNYEAQESGIPCQFKQKIGKKYALKTDVIDENHILDKWKMLLPKSPIAGQTDFTKPLRFYYDGNTFIAEPGCCCTDTFIVAYAADTKDEILSFRSYIFSKVVEFLLLQSVISQDVVSDKWKFVPKLDKFEGTYTDSRLCKLWNITEEEYEYIDSRIRDLDSVGR